MMRGRRWRLGAVIGCALVALAVLTTAAQRRVVGTVRTVGTVEGALPPNGWQPLTSGAAVEGMSVRTGGTGSAAVLELSNGDLIGITEHSSIQIGDGSPPRVRLEEGRAAYRLRAASPTVIETPQGALRALPTEPASTGGQLAEGTIAIADGTTTVLGHRGSADVVGADGQVVPVKAGQQATLAAPDQPITVADTTMADAGTGAVEGGRGSVFDRFPSILGLSPKASAALVGGAVVAGAGAGIGVGVSQGGGDGDDGVGQGSPFKPKKKPKTPKKPKKPKKKP
jgi:hypothetical protein